MPRPSLLSVLLLAAVLALLSSQPAQAAYQHQEEQHVSCAYPPPLHEVAPLRGSMMRTQPIHFAPGAAPASFDWRDEAPIQDHFSQRSALSWCGSCWAAATSVAITDRFRIHHRRAFGQRKLSVQALLNCGSRLGVGNCSGGSWEKSYDYIAKHGLVDETCMPYMGMDRSFNTQGDCEKDSCRECTLDGSCRIVPNAKRFYVSKWGSVSGEAAMVDELAARGPLTCYIYTHLPEFSNYKGGIIPVIPVSPPGNITHVVAVYGYGADAATGDKYWIARNWSGANWGEDGYFRIARGGNSLNIEWNCGWGEPSLQPNDPEDFFGRVGK